MTFVNSRSGPKIDYLVNVSLDLDFNADPVNADTTQIIAFSAFITGAPSGTLTLQGAVGDAFPGGIPDINGWHNMTKVTFTAGLATSINGVAVPSILQSPDALYDAFSGCNWFRLVWENTSGSGTINASWAKKG